MKHNPTLKEVLLETPMSRLRRGAQNITSFASPKKAGPPSFSVLKDNSKRDISGGIFRRLFYTGVNWLNLIRNVRAHGIPEGDTELTLNYFQGKVHIVKPSHQAAHSVLPPAPPTGASNHGEVTVAEVYSELGTYPLFRLITFSYFGK